MLHTFIIDLGYVESSRLAKFTFSHEEGFPTLMEGMESIRSVLISLVKEIDKPCCEESRFLNFDYCKKCGKRLKKELFLNEAAADLFNKLLTSNVDSASGEGIWDAFEEAGWNLIGEDPGKEEPSRVYVQNVERWMAEESDFLEWFIRDESYSTYRE